MAKIAVELDRALARRRQDAMPGSTAPRIIASGDGWTVTDVMCTFGPHDHPFEEQHTHVTIAIVLAGSFQYRSQIGRGLMTPGSLMLGNHGHCFECAHQHGAGDRCVSFSYAPEYFERLAADAGTGVRSLAFDVARLPPLRQLSPIIARASAGVLGAVEVPWEEMAVTLAVQSVRVAAGMAPVQDAFQVNAEANVSRLVRAIDRHPAAHYSLQMLARWAGLSPYHFLRTFERLTAVTPHQYVRRVRLREAARQLLIGSDKVLDVALECGFGDVSNFNRAFRTEFGMSPRAFRRT